MRIIATSDTHFAFDNSLIPDGDVFIHSGDLMYKGTPDEWEAVVQSLAALPHKTKILVPGNHDYFCQHYHGLARSDLRRRANVSMLTEGVNVIKAGNERFSLLAIPYVTGLTGWAYCVDETWLYDYIKNHADSYYPAIDFVVSHSPPYKILDAEDGNHYGAMAMNRWFYGQRQPVKHWISGHIHGSYGTAEIDGTKFYNVAMCDENYDQVNPAMVIDL